MFEFVGNIVQGGWDAIGNVTGTIGRGASYVASGFFPTTQRTTPIVSATTKAAGGSGMTYRPTPPENQSMFESLAWASQDWLNSPYEEQLARGYNTPGRQALANIMSGGAPSKSWGDNLVDFFKGTANILGQAGQVKTIVNDFMQDWGLVKRETVVSTPREGYPAGQDEQHLNDIGQAGANVLTMIRGAGGAFLDQVKGLFNLGYPQNSSQPGFVLQHEIQPSAKTTIGLAAAAGIIILVIILGRRK